MLNAYSNLGRVLLFACLAAGLSACNQYQDNGLLGDAKDDVCPPGCSQSIKADDSQISIKIMNISPLRVSATDTRADIAGECYPSIYPSNKIVVSLSNSSGTASYAVNYSGIDPLSQNIVVCKNGRFNFTVDTSSLAAGGYSVKATLIGLDSSNGEHRNDSDGSSYISLLK